MSDSIKKTEKHQSRRLQGGNREARAAGSLATARETSPLGLYSINDRIDEKELEFHNYFREKTYRINPAKFPKLSKSALIDPTSFQNPAIEPPYAVLKVYRDLSTVKRVSYTKQDRSAPTTRVITIRNQDDSVWGFYTKPVSSKRGVISGFSTKSRKRMIESLAMLQAHNEKAFFVTLTYPDQFPHPEQDYNGRKGWQVSKSHKTAWEKRLLRRFSDAFGGWKVEVKARKSGMNEGKIATHYHLMIWGVDIDLMYFRKWARDAWHAIIQEYLQDCPESYKQKAWEHGCDVQRINDHAHMSRYVAKYVAKDDDNDLNKLEIGRRWGFFNREIMDFSPVHEIEFTEQQYKQFSDHVRGWALARGYAKYQNFIKVLFDWLDRSYSVLGLGDTPNDPQNEGDIFKILALAFKNKEFHEALPAIEIDLS